MTRRGYCWRCGRDVSLTNMGRLRRHRSRSNDGTACPESGHAPDPNAAARHLANAELRHAEAAGDQEIVEAARYRLDE